MRFSPHLRAVQMRVQIPQGGHATKNVSIIARFLLGLMFTVFGLNEYLKFIHRPPPSELQYVHPSASFFGYAGEQLAVAPHPSRLDSLFFR
jgi:hypothetical protein